MKNMDEVETAQSREPISKMAKKNRNVFFALRYVYSFPVRGCKAALVPRLDR